jgi:hypothetical protein
VLLRHFRDDEALDVGDRRRHGSSGADGVVVCGRGGATFGVEAAAGCEAALETLDAPP